MCSQDAPRIEQTPRIEASVLPRQVKPKPKILRLSHGDARQNWLFY